MGDRSKRKNDWRDIEKHIISNKENKLRRFKYLKNLIKGKNYIRIWMQFRFYAFSINSEKL